MGDISRVGHNSCFGRILRALFCIQCLLSLSISEGRAQASTPSHTTAALLQGFGLAGVPNWSALEAQLSWQATDSSRANLQCLGFWQGWSGRGAAGLELRVGLVLAPGLRCWTGLGTRPLRGGVFSIGASYDADRRLAFHAVLPLRTASLEIDRPPQAAWQALYEAELPGAWRALFGLASNFGQLSPTMGLAKVDHTERRAQIQWRGPWRGWLLRASAPVKSWGTLSVSWAIQSAAPARWGWTAARGNPQWTTSWDSGL
jgi:hypothetical protein